jgi:hypothetical protein
VPKFARVMFAAIATLAGAFPVFAATYVVPEDRLLVDRADAIVVATVLDSCSRFSETMGIETVTTLRVEEAIKGPLGPVVDIVEPGGTYGEMNQVLAGAPVFDRGEHVLLLLFGRPDGEWAVLDLALGKFSFARDTRGQSLLVRSAGEIVGWDSQLRPYTEKRRSADAFLSFIREQVNHHAPAADYFVSSYPLDPRVSVESTHLASPSISPYTAASYTLGAARWPGFPSTVTYGRGTSTEPGAGGGGDNAINAAMNAWNGISGATIKLAYNGVSAPDTGLQPSSGDSRNAIQFERDLSWRGIPPFTCSQNSYSGVLGIGGYFSLGTHTGPNSEVFHTITEGDVEMNVGIANCTLLFNGGDFDSAVTHEVGHSIGWRHADQAPDGSGCVSASMECSSSAIMTSFVTLGLHAAPQAWDQHAAQAVYPSGVGCTAPSISTQPVGATINSGQSANLSVTATGTSPFTYQWYTGASGNTSSPIGGATNSSVMVSPTTTTSYWVRVTGQCAPPADSTTATVTVNCAPPSISVQPAGSTITSGQSANLSVTATGTSPFTYQWYTGTSGNTASPIGGATNSSVMVSPTTTTSYWVRVTGQCAPPIDSSTATVTVAACVNPSISQQPGNVTINSGSSTQLSVGAAGTGLTFQWYVGNPPSTLNPVAGGTFTSLNVSPSQTTNFWVRVSGQCGSPADSNAATVTVVCNPPAITQQPSSASIPAGSSTLLTVGATGTSLTYQWYVGTAPDTTLPVAGGSTATIQVSPSQTTNFWVRVSGACGSPQNSATATITVGACTSPVISGAAANPSNVLPGGSSQLSASVSGSISGQPQWYIGTPPDKSHPVAQAGATVTVMPSSNTTYWLQALSGCGAAATNSNAVTVTVGSSCINPTITIQPASQNVIAGTTVTLGVTAGGTAPLHYQWYQGPSGTKTTPVGTNSAFFTTDPVNSTKQFWVEVSNSCNGGVPAQSTTATVTPYLSRHRSARH